MLLVNKICEHLSGRIENNELTNDDIVQIIEHLGYYLNLQTISDYAKTNQISYNGVKHFRTIREIFNVKFVIDNE
jgi:hypothetical protein